ncbi:MAG: AAA family ATPase [Desulfobacterales bacterium]|nr:AAA family ATPase [Desulfobacterales bacterium]
MFSDLSIFKKELIYQKGYNSIYRAFHSGKSYIIKENRSGLHSDIISHEYMISSSIDLRCIVRPLSYQSNDNKTYIVYEDLFGEPLLNIIEKVQLSIKERLIISVKLSKILIELHDVGIIHNNVNLNNFIYNPATKIIKITDLTGTSLFLEEHKAFDNKTLMKAVDSFYISPEQTGEISKPIDYRTDLYSLGISFYKIFTGVFPFNENLIENHINEKPLSPKSVNPSINSFLSEIILKLIEKDPSKRYQSGTSLKYDLLKCLKNNSSLKPGSTDIKAQINDNYIYPRTKLIAPIIKSFRKSRVKDFFLLSGNSGIGKTSVIKFFKRRLFERKILFLHLSNSKTTKNIPYYSLVSSFKDVKDKIQNLELLPNELKDLIGLKSKENSDVYVETENGFIYILHNLIKDLFKEKKVVIFIEDIESIDSGSKKVIGSVLEDARFDNLTIIGTIDSNHKLSEKISEIIEKNSIEYNILMMKKLSCEAVLSLVSGSLFSNKIRTRELTNYIFSVTDGDPLFVNILLKYIQRKGLIEYNCHRGIFKWNLNRIKSSEIPLNLESLLSKILYEYTEDEKVFIQSAACFGYIFKKEIVLRATNIKEEFLTDNLNLLITKDDKGSELCFRSSRLQNFIISNITIENVRISKKNFARVLLNELTKEDIFKIFQIVYFLNDAREFIIKDHEKVSLAELNLFCGIHLNKLFRFKDALLYIKKGLITDKTLWEENYGITSKIHTELLRTSFNAGDFNTMDEIAELIVDNDKNEKRSVKDLIISTISQNNVINQSIIDIDKFDLPEKRLNIKDLSNEIVVKAMDKFDGNKTRAAKYLGISRQALYRRLEKV